MEHPELSSYNDNDLVDCAIQVYARVNIFNCIESNKDLHDWSMKLVQEIKRRLADRGARRNEKISDNTGLEKA